MQKPTEFAQCFVDRLADRLYTDEELFRPDEAVLPAMQLPRAHAATAWVHHARTPPLPPTHPGP